MKIKAVIATSVISLFIFATPVFALTPIPSPTPRPLSEASLRSCQAREAAVKNRMQSLTNLATNIEKVFDSIAMRVEDFYTIKVIPSGKILKNYDTLVEDISAKKGIVDTDITAAGEMVSMFSCTGSDPRGLLLNFRLSMQKVKTDLKNYRTSIKNLIVAVRPLAPTPAPGPTATPM